MPLTQRTYNVSFSENPPPTPEQSEWMQSYMSSMIPIQAITPELIELFQKISEFGYGLVKKANEFSTSENI